MHSSVYAVSMKISRVAIVGSKAERKRWPIYNIIIHSKSDRQQLYDHMCTLMEWADTVSHTLNVRLIAWISGPISAEAFRTE